MWRGKNPIAHHAWFMVEPAFIINGHRKTRTFTQRNHHSVSVCERLWHDLWPDPTLPARHPR